MDDSSPASSDISDISDVSDAAYTPMSHDDVWLRTLETLEYVTTGAIAHLDLQTLLKDLLSRVRVSMSAENAAILLLNEDKTELTVYSARGVEEQVEGVARVPIGRGIAGTIAASGEPMIIDDLSQFEVEIPLLQATAHSLVGVPLLANGRVIGVMHVDSARPRRFTTADSRMLQVIGSRAALAIEHARLYAAEHDAQRRLQALQAVSDVALAHARLGELLRALLDRIQTTMAVDNVAILLPTPDGAALTLYSVRGPEESVMGRVRVPMGEGVAGTIAARREPYVIDNLAAVPVSNPFLREHFHSLLGVPLLVGDRLVGVLHVDSVTPRRFTDDETELLQVIGERIALAIDRARELESAEATRAEAESRVAALKEVTQRMDEFLGIASHELRTPLTSLYSNVQLLDHWLVTKRRLQPDETDSAYAARAIEAVQPLIRRSAVSIRRLNRLIGELLDIARIQENQLELRLELVDLRDIVLEAVEEQRRIHPNRTIEYAGDGAGGGAALVLADADRIGQVVTNYLTNALKYSTAEQPVTAQIERVGDRARVSTRDLGAGIPPEEHERIWDRFYRVRGVGHQSGSQVGLGLGLYICHDIILRHDGEVGVQSAPGHGSTFWFTLPLAHDPSADMMTEASGQRLGAGTTLAGAGE